MIKGYDTGSEIVINGFETKEILYAFHDIDGTHSLIRNWPPVMSICLYDVIQNGLPEDFDSPENERRLIDAAGSRTLEETDRFCVESAGLSALTQMEWAIRRAVEEGTVKVECDRALNSEIIKKIWDGEENFSELGESRAIVGMIETMAPRLFKLYEAVLNGYCRDKNLAEARKDPERFRVNGSMEFMKFLKDNGVRNYFVTGAVVEKGMGMHEEVETLGYKIGSGELVEDIIGSTWTEKLPKDVIMAKLRVQLGADGKNVLVVGDGRAEISAGAAMGALTVSRLPENAEIQRKLHARLGTNIMISDYTDKRLYDVLRAEKE